MKYFIQDDLVHEYPVPNNCDAVYDNERLYDKPPRGCEKCAYCFETRDELEEDEDEGESW